MRKLFKRIAIMLCLVMTVNILGNDVNYVSAEETGETVYVDGLAFSYYVDNEGNTIVKCLEESEAEIVLGNDGEAEASLGDEEYLIKFYELSQDNIDATVFDEDGDVFEEYTNIDQIIEDNYEGQASIAIPITALSLITLIEVLILISATVVISGVTCHAVSKVYADIKNDNKKKKYYYRAYLSGVGVYIDYQDPISANDAKILIQSRRSIYTWSKDLAYACVAATGMGTIKNSEINVNREKGYIYYYHWHTAGRNGAHAWYGQPYTK